MAEKRRREDDLPAAVFGSGGVVPQDVAGQVGGFAGGLIEHLSAIKDAALAKILDGKVADFRKLLAAQPPDTPVVSLAVKRENDESDEFRTLLQKRIPEADVYYSTEPPCIYIVALRPEKVVKHYAQKVMARAQSGYNNHCVDVAFHLPVCAFHTGCSKRPYNAAVVTKNNWLAQKCRQKLADALTAEGLPPSPPGASPQKGVRLSDPSVEYKGKRGEESYTVSFRTETRW
eukprot:TRINITY_DN56484_c0_g1_i1.p1 TRINITY_DN56484_c0_g1~~TRINITY_DN56484_c0_g1_i1.p1  ORF type:complete len:231 (+),score=48.55 TRINITY_DN56484_c0_g1_i1:97-789(+)